MRAALKALVIIMGLMILAGLALLVAIIAGRAVHRKPAPSPAPTAFSAAPITLPAGARIATMRVGADRLVLDIALPDGSHQLIVIDLATGRRLGTIPLRTAP